MFVDLTVISHLLIAGQRGFGVTNFINTVIASILYQAKASMVKIMLYSKTADFDSIKEIPHLMSPIISTPRQAIETLKWAVEELNRRYDILCDCKIRNISMFNAELSRLKSEIDSKLETMPRIVIIIHEMADLMTIESGAVERAICHIATMGRSVGIHLIITTYQASPNFLTGVIRANIPSKIAFSVPSSQDSCAILDMEGAEKLLGRGDMLFVTRGLPGPLRIQSFKISKAEMQAAMQWGNTLLAEIY